MKGTALLALAFTVVFASDAKAYEVDLPNPDFEQGTCCGTPPGWAGGGIAPVTGVQMWNYVLNPNIYARTGLGFGRLYAPAGQSGTMYAYTSVYITPGANQTATLDMYVRSNTFNTRVWITEYDPSWNVTQFNYASSFAVPFDVWYSIQNEVGPWDIKLHPSTVFLSIGLYTDLNTLPPGYGNYFDIDDVSLTIENQGDECYVGEQNGGSECRLRNYDTQSWMASVEDGPGHLHNRARNYSAWLRKIMPAGGVMPAVFTDSSYTTLAGYDHTRDSALITGIYLAAESLHFMVTKSADAEDQLEETVRVLDRWWRISGDRGYLARFAAPTSSPQSVLDIFDSQDPEDHMYVPFEGDTWHWKGDVSRDQYQGIMLGYSLAYEATSDEEIKEIIRARVVEFVEQLATFEKRDVNLQVNGTEFGEIELEMGHCIYTDDETPDGKPEVVLETSPFSATLDGVVTFWPNPSEFLREVPGFSWLPDIEFRSQAVQLAGMFQVALQVTEGVPAYASRRAAIQAHYDSYFGEWASMADDWSNTNECGDSYHGLNIAFIPLWNWIDLESGFAKEYLQLAVLRDRFWPAVDDHKNVFFAFINASQAHPSENVTGIIDDHVAQLQLFPSAPNDRPYVNNTSLYTADPSCSGNSLVAIDVGDRVPRNFMWEKHPWKLVDSGYSNYLNSGVDYLIAYWMARYYGYLADDSVGQGLKFD